ncbi:MAG: hypothetical protein GY796_34565 [Chloroflexi bacterium]|nr:hypothetical protein [Chloroflexota bacterium]
MDKEKNGYFYPFLSQTCNDYHPRRYCWQFATAVHSNKPAKITITISGPTYRLADGIINSFAVPLLETTHKISADLGFNQI